MQGRCVALPHMMGRDLHIPNGNSDNVHIMYSRGVVFAPTNGIALERGEKRLACVCAYTQPYRSISTRALEARPSSACPHPGPSTRASCSALVTTISRSIHTDRCVLPCWRLKPAYGRSESCSQRESEHDNTMFETRECLVRRASWARYFHTDERKKKGGGDVFLADVYCVRTPSATAER